MGTPVSGNVLATANVPAGTTAQVTGFSVAGSTQVYPAGSNVTLNDPVTGEPIGTLVLKSSGDYTFAPVPGYVGPTPAVQSFAGHLYGVCLTPSWCEIILMALGLTFIFRRLYRQSEKLLWKQTGLEYRYPRAFPRGH